jgi:hypothetical protein
MAISVPADNRERILEQAFADLLEKVDYAFTQEPRLTGIENERERYMARTGIHIETIDESHGGAFAGSHASAPSLSLPSNGQNGTVPKFIELGRTLHFNVRFTP